MSSGIPKLLPSNGTYICPSDIQVNTPGNPRERENINGGSSIEETLSNYEQGTSRNSGTSVVNYPGQDFFNWQAPDFSVKNRIASLLNKEFLSDVHFIVGKGERQQRIPAHKFILSIGSAVFDAMFNGALAASSDEIELPDVEPAAFLALLRFLYSDEVQICPETVMMTLYTAKKYDVPALEKACVEFLKSNLSSDNAFMFLTQARQFDELQLATLCLETTDKYSSKLLTSGGFTDTDHDTLCTVIETLKINENEII